MDGRDSRPGDGPSVLEPAERRRRGERGAALAEKLSGTQVVGVAMSWVDTSGLSRVKAVPIGQLGRAAAWGVGASPVFDTFLIDDVPVTGRFAGGPVGDLRLHPDLDRLVVLSAQPGWAWAPADRYDQDGARHPQDHRWLAGCQVEALRRNGYHVRAAFEIEWALSAGFGDEFVPACAGPAYGLIRLTELSDYTAALLRALAEQHVRVDQVHPEYAAGQYELSVAAADPVAAADTAVLVRETIRAVSRAHGLRATFAPKVLADGVGNGGHLHLSLWRDGEEPGTGVNTMSGGSGPAGLDRDGEAFAAGVLAHLPALLALGAPSTASYLRLVPSAWAGAFACWGVENREAALRLVPGPAGNRDQAANLEIKCFDQAANPYLLLAGVLAAGRDGLAGGATLPAPVTADPAGLDPADASAAGVRRLPMSLPDAVDAFETDQVLAAALGEVVADTVATVRRAEARSFADASAEQVVAATRWRF